MPGTSDEIAELRERLRYMQRKATDSAARIATLEAALEKIDAIRNSIIGLQSVNWSAHVYPLVEALREAGFEGEGYEVARAKALNDSMQRRDETLVTLEAALRCAEGEVASLRIVASAAREYLMRSVPDPNVGTAAEDTLREALADLEMTDDG